MKLQPIITSLLETDLYKFSMGQAIYHLFSDYKTTWSFKCRNADVVFTKEMVDEIRDQVHHYCRLHFTDDELKYLHDITWLKGSYVNFLRIWRPQFSDITVAYDESIPCHLSIESRGTWLNTSMYEIPLLAIVNEVYFRMQYDYEALLTAFKEKANEKVHNLCNRMNIGVFSEFGLRRRLSAESQEYIIEKLIEADHSFQDSKFVGTSNVYLAKKFNVKPVGTMAHEWIMCVGQGTHRHNPAYSNWYSLNAWVRQYGVLNGIALTDTITTDCFLRDFQLTFATLFSGVRHDSGDPIAWGNKMLAHYHSLGIDPRTKTLLFSDSLNFANASHIYETFKDQVQVAFGIGTYLSNDTSVKPLNIVMKVTACNGGDVAKLSDVEGKGMCKNEDYVDYLKRCIDWRMNHDR